MVSEGAYQALFFVTTHSVIVVDAPPSLVRLIQRAVAEVTKNPISHLVYSHSHADHIGGASVFAAANPRLKVIAHEETRRILKRDIGDDPLDRPLPTTVFSKQYTLRVDNQTLELSFRGDNHSPDNIFIWAPAQRILMLVDVITPGWAPFRSLALATSIPGFIRAHDMALEYPFETFVGGHLNRAGTRDDIITQREYVRDLYNNCAAAVEASADPNNTALFAGSILPPVAAANPGNSWGIFRAYYDTLASYCGAQTSEKWIGRLGAVDVFEFESASSMVLSVRIDFGILGPFGVPPA